MNANNIRVLPIVDEADLVGIVTRRDLLRYDPSAMMKSNWDQYVGIGGQAVNRIMTKNVATIKADALLLRSRV
jgi:CBS domain-containing protein